MKSLILFVSLASVCAAQSAAGPTAVDIARKESIFSQYLSYKKYFPEVRDITPFEISEMLENDAKIVLVDVREKEERTVSIIPDALSKKEFEKRREEFRDHLVVPYCTIGYRSGKYSEELGPEGFRVRNLAGSILLWAHQVGTLIHDGKPTQRIHVMGRKWNLAPESFEAVW